jgi:hypothetical protein
MKLSFKNIIPKNMDEETVDKLMKSRKNYKMVFYVYLIFECIMVMIAGVIGTQMVDAVLNYTDSTLFTMLLLFGVMNILNFFMLFVIWFCCESSYYKMMQCFSDQMIFLKKKLGE